LFVVVKGTVGSVVIATGHGTRIIPPIVSRAARTMGSVGFHQWTRVIQRAAEIDVTILTMAASSA